MLPAKASIDGDGFIAVVVVVVEECWFGCKVASSALLIGIANPCFC